MLEEARFAALIARSDRLVTAAEALSVATVGGAGCLGMNGAVGELTEGAQADLVVLSLNEAHQLPTYDPVVSTIFSSSGRDVLLTVVAGKEIFKDGRVVNVDEGRLRARMMEIAEKL